VERLDWTLLPPKQETREVIFIGKQVGIGERTLLRWLQEDRAFQGSYRTARCHVVQHAVAQVQQATSTAVATLEAIMQDATVSESLWKQNLYKTMFWVICLAKPRTDLLDNRSLAILLETYKLLIC
jgi:hypothetical protein